jgi:hypothetical protein
MGLPAYPVASISTKGLRERVAHQFGAGHLMCRDDFDSTLFIFFLFSQPCCHCPKLAD